MLTGADDTELTLTQGDLRLKVAPWGASLRGLCRETSEGDAEIVTPYSGMKGKVGGQGDVLIPFPGRGVICLTERPEPALISAPAGPVRRVSAGAHRKRLSSE